MATKKAETVTSDASTVVLAEPITLESFADMKLQQKQLAARIKAAKAALPKRTPLQMVLARQAAGITHKHARTYFSNLLRARVKAGQNVDEAQQEVLAMFTAWLNEESARIANEV